MTAAQELPRFGHQTSLENEDMSTSFPPAAHSAFDIMLRMAHAKNIDRKTVFGSFLDAVLVVPGGPGSENMKGAFEPVIVTGDGKDFMVVFSILDHVKTFLTEEQAPYLSSIRAVDVIAGLPAGMGIVVNPGTEVTFKIESALVDSARAVLAKTKRAQR